MRTLVLTERVPHVCSLHPEDVEFLVAGHRRHLELLPTGRRHRYRLTTTGVAGLIVAPHCRLVIRPKIPLANLFALLAPDAPPPIVADTVTLEAGTETLDFLARRLAHLLAERAAAGLQRGYRERFAQGPFLQGRLDLPAQLRQSPVRKSEIHSHHDDFTADLPCNQVPRATAEQLLASPLLSADTRAALRQALLGFECVQPAPLTPDAWDAVVPERLPPEYRPLVELCRLLVEGLTPEPPAGPTPAPAFLLDMERVFEAYLTRGVLEAFAGRANHLVRVQCELAVNQPADDQPDIVMRPDLAIERRGRTVLVVDAKWKRLPSFALLPPDTYQVLAYCTALGGARGVLVYPGRRDRTWEYRFPHAPVELVVRTLRVTGSPDALARSLQRLGRYLRGRSE
jgi:5-methylcytosine-specific restriction enzyme subunit McrC